MNGPGWHNFTFDPPLLLDTQRYLFLLDSIQGGSIANMMLSSTNIASQYTVLDQEIDASHTAVFSYCMVPDYIPSPSPSASVSATPSSTPSTQPSDENNNTKKSNAGVIAGATIGAIAVVFIGAAVFAFLFIRKNKRRHAGEMSPKADLELYSAHASTRQDGEYQPIGVLAPSSHYTVIPAESEWNIEYKALKLTKEIGRGAFGVVYQGTWKGVQVAGMVGVSHSHCQVKQALLDSSSLKMQDFFGEAEVMKKLKPHPNVTRLLGLCFNPVCIVLEFVDNGSLWNWLASNKSLDSNTQISIARGIAAGTHSFGDTSR